MFQRFVIKTGAERWRLATRISPVYTLSSRQTQTLTHAPPLCADGSIWVRNKSQFTINFNLTPLEHNMIKHYNITSRYVSLMVEVREGGTWKWNEWCVYFECLEIDASDVISVTFNLIPNLDCRYAAAFFGLGLSVCFHAYEHLMQWGGRRISDGDNQILGEGQRGAKPNTYVLINSF